MNPEIKAKWVAALRSGEYKQGVGWLRTNDHFCCLGVLCDLHAKETGAEWEPYDDDRELSKHQQYAGNAAYLPDAVFGWSGRISADATGMLMQKNDDREPFSEIADIIEREL